MENFSQDEFIHKKKIFFLVFSWLSFVFLSVLMILTIGWELHLETLRLFKIVVLSFAGVFFIVETAQFVLLKESFLNLITKRFLEFFFILYILIGFVIGVFYFDWVKELISNSEERAFFIFNFFFLLGGLFIYILRGIRGRHLLTRYINLTPGRVFILSFAALILFGACLLQLPRATVNGIAWIDSLFISTSAVCVTGLSPLDISVEFTRLGQYILIGLIQLGGLGVMSITYFFAYFFAGGLSLKNCFGFQDLFNEDNLSQIGVVLGIMIVYTLGVETVGAAWIYFTAASLDNSITEPIFFSIFHSISAFCNAGFSTIKGGLSHIDVNSNISLLTGITMLTVLGGIGFPVVKNIWLVWVNFLRRKILMNQKGAPVRLTTHAKIVLSMTGVLLILGVLLLYLTGFTKNPDGTFLRAVFLSASSRTAGFDIGDTAGLATGTLVVVMVLMLIGGSPFSTAGGIKTTTFAVALLSIRRFLLGRQDLEIFGRRISNDLSNQALSIIILYIFMVSLATIALCTFHPDLSLTFLLFETISASATVGLSCNITPLLCAEAKMVLILVMFIGRIGVLLFLSSIISKSKVTGIRYPEDTVVLS